MSKIIGYCGKCDGKVIQLDPLEDWALYGALGEFMTEHKAGCPDYPKLREVKLGDL